jgi:hypothetical protein
MPRPRHERCITCRQGGEPMQLARIVFAGALLFGVGCVPSEEVADEHQVSHYAIDEIVTMEGRTLPEEECTFDIVRLTDEEVEELQDILNTAIEDDELVFARLDLDQVARVQIILASAIVP